MKLFVLFCDVSLWGSNTVLLIYENLYFKIFEKKENDEFEENKTLTMTDMQLHDNCTMYIAYLKYINYQIKTQEIITGLQYYDKAKAIIVDYCPWYYNNDY